MRDTTGGSTGDPSRVLSLGVRGDPKVGSSREGRHGDGPTTGRVEGNTVPREEVLGGRSQVATRVLSGTEPKCLLRPSVGRGQRYGDEISSTRTET